MSDFISNCAPEPYYHMNNIYPQADWCVFDPINYNIMIVTPLTIRIGGVEYITPNPPYCGGNSNCGFWDNSGNCTPALHRKDCTAGEYMDGNCINENGEITNCDTDGDGITDLNNNLCYPNACQIKVEDCQNNNDGCHCVEQNGSCDAIALLYQGTVVAINYINTSVISGTPSSGFDVGISMIDENWLDAFDHIGYPPAGEFIDDIIFYRASTGTHHSLTNSSWQYIFEEQRWGTLMTGRIFPGLSNHIGGLVQFPTTEITYPIDECIFEFEEVDTAPVTDILYELHQGSNLGEGNAAMQISPGNWLGSLTELEPHRGYWFIANEDVSFSLIGNMMDNNHLYQLHTGANLISYSGEIPIPIENAFSDDVEPYIDGVLTEGEASLQISPGNWIGSLGEFTPFKGYWVVANQNINFTFNGVGSSTVFNQASVIIPPTDNNGNYQNPNSGVYNWGITDVINYLKLQLTGTIEKEKTLRQNKKKIEEAIKSKKPNKSIRRSFGK